MLVSGVFTVTMFYGLFAPQAGLELMFGASFTGTLETIVIRSWSALIGLIGAVLIFGAFSNKHRVFSIVVASLSKLIFVSLMLLYGQEFLGNSCTGYRNGLRSNRPRRVFPGRCEYAAISRITKACCRTWQSRAADAGVMRQDVTPLQLECEFISKRGN